MPLPMRLRRFIVNTNLRTVITMSLSRVGLILLAVCLASASHAAVAFLANFNDSLDAAFSLGSRKAAVTGPARITSGKQGHPFAGEAVSEALDLSYSDPSADAAVEYEAPLFDLRSGTVSFWIKTGFNWGTAAPTPEKAFEEHQFFYLPTEGGVYNGIRMEWYNRWGPWFHFYLYDGESQGQIGLTPTSAETLGIDLRPNMWHYVVGVWTPLQMRLFIDGKLVQEAAPEKPLKLGKPDGPLHFGAGTLRGLKLKPANALLDGFRLSNQALYAGLKEVPVPTAAPTTEEDTGPGPTLAVGGPGTQLNAKPRKTYTCPKLASPPIIDGDLSDPVWRSAPRAGGFCLLGLEQPYANAQATVQAGWDAQNLYLGVTCYENRMAELRAAAHGKDSAAYADDAVEVFLGPWTDRIKDYFQFVANTGDGTYDGKGLEAQWNGEWQHAAKKQGDRWTLEIAIPFRTLGADPPVRGTLWGWNVARDRVAGGGVDALSSLAAMAGGWHTPEQFDKLLFADQPLDVAAEEGKLNADYFAATREDLAKKIGDADRELLLARKLLARAQVADVIADARQAVETLVQQYQAARAHTPDLDECNRLRLSFRDFDRTLADYAVAANKLGFVFAGAVPPNLKPGVARAGKYWYLVSPELTAAIDPSTGVLCGLSDAKGKPLLRWSYDVYFTETPTTTSRSDERLDEVTGSKTQAGTLQLTCKNELIPGAIITKRYFLAAVGKDQRILCKEFAVSGSPKDKTLLSLVSRTHFDEAFRQEAYYHRVIPAGTLGDPRAVFPATGIKDPILIHFLFNVGAAANLCAVNTRDHRGVGEYWFKANGKWVIPCGYENNKSYLTDTGWDLSWFVTFITPQSQSAELRYHLFDGDRVTFHEEYRDLPERQSVINAVPVSEAARQRRYEVNLGPQEGGYDWSRPDTQYGQMIPFIAGRLRSHEYAAHFGCPYNDLRYGDYPTGDDAQLHYEYGENSPAYPAAKMRDGILAGTKVYPRLESGWYHSPLDIGKLSNTYRDHPEWILRDKAGQPVPSYWHPLYVRATWTPEYVNHLLARLTAQMDYFGMPLMYLDYTITGPIVDWGRGVVWQSDVSYDFLTRLYREVQKRNGILFLNAETFDGVHDIGYWEGFSKYDAWGGDWRNVADAMMMRRLYDRPGLRSVPLYWYGGDMFGDRRNYRDYTNLVLTHLFTTTGCWHDPYEVHFKDPATGKTDWAGVLKHSVAYYDTTFEASGNVWRDVDLTPCWYRDPATNIEAYAFRKGSAHLLTALRHDQITGDVILSADAAKLGLSPEKPVFVWQFFPRDPDQFPRHGGPQPEGWDRLFTRRSCALLPPGRFTPRAGFSLPGLEPLLPRLLVVTQVPAVFSSLEGRATNLLLPELLGGKIEGPLRASTSGYEVKVSTVYPAEILLYAPAGLTKARVNGQPASVSPEAYGDLTFLRVAVPAGETTVSVAR